MATNTSEPAIPKGIDILTGRQVTAEHASKGKRYLCIYCHEPVEFRKGSERRPYFAHKKIYERTPLQQLCPGYHGGNSGSYDINDVEIAYIVNGGIPVYLCEVKDGLYELRADFHCVSEKTWNMLTDYDYKVRIQVDYHGRNLKYQIKLKNQSYFKLNHITDSWYDVSYENQIQLPSNAEIRECLDEVSRKWKWGIEGVRLDSTIFRATNMGGTRVAENANIALGKEYLMLHAGKRNLPVIDGIHFQCKGTILLQGFQYFVYSFVIREITAEAKRYIGEKGYQLIPQNDAIVPIWPPAAIKGRTLYFPLNQKIYIYHEQKKSQVLQWFGEKSEERTILHHEENLCVSYCNQSITIGDPEFNRMSGEIRYDFIYYPSAFFSEYLKPEIECTYGEDSFCRVTENSKLYRDDVPVSFSVSIDTARLLALRNSVVLQTLDKTIPAFTGIDSMVIIAEPYISLKVPISGYRNIVKKECNSLESRYVKGLFLSNYAAMVPIKEDYSDILHYAETNDKRLYYMLLQWKRIGKMPYPAKIICKKLREVLHHENK